MSKAKNKGAAASKVAALAPEEFQALTPEQQAEYLTSLQKSNAELAAKAEALEAAGKPAADEPLVIEVEEDAANDIEGGEYQFQVKKFIFEEREYSVKELRADLEGKDKKKAEKATAIVAKLVKMKSGILARKED